MRAAEPAQELVLIRHAAATGQEAEAPLTAEGYRQALQLAQVLLPLGIERGAIASCATAATLRT